MEQIFETKAAVIGVFGYNVLLGAITANSVQVWIGIIGGSIYGMYWAVKFYKDHFKKTKKDE